MFQEDVAQKQNTVGSGDSNTNFLFGVNRPNSNRGGRILKKYVNIMPVLGSKQQLIN